MDLTLIIIKSYIVYWIISAIGITYGYHRYFCHKEYKTNKIFEIIMLYLGSLCGCQSPISWSGVHRMHHAYFDTLKDPHSPIFKKWYEIYNHKFSSTFPYLFRFSALTAKLTSSYSLMILTTLSQLTPGYIGKLTCC